MTKVLIERNRLLIIALLVSTGFHFLVLILFTTFFSRTQQSRIALRFLSPYFVERYRPRYFTEGSGIGKGRGMEMFHERGEAFSLPEGPGGLSFQPGVGRGTMQIPGEGKGYGGEGGLAYLDRFISTPQGKEPGLKGKGGLGIIEPEPRGSEVFPRWGGLIPKELPSPLREGDLVIEPQLGHPSIIAIDRKDKSKTRGFWYIPGDNEGFRLKLKPTGIMVKYSGKKFDMASTDRAVLEYPVIFLGNYLSSKYNTIEGLVSYLRRGGFLVAPDNHISVKYNRFYWQVRAEVEKQVGSSARYLGTEENELFLNTYYDMRDLGWPSAEGYHVDKNGFVFDEGPCPSFLYLESVEIGGRIVAVFGSIKVKIAGLNSRKQYQYPRIPNPFSGSIIKYIPGCRMNELYLNILYYALIQPGSITRQVTIEEVTQQK